MIFYEKGSLTLLILCRDLENEKGTEDFFNLLLDKGKNHKICYGCNRGLGEDDMRKFERYVRRSSTFTFFFLDYETYISPR